MYNQFSKTVRDYEKTQDIQQFNDELKSLLKNFLKSDLVSLFIYNKKHQTLELKLFYEREKDVFEHFKENTKYFSMIAPKGCIGKVFLTKSPKLYNYITSDKDYFQEYDNDTGHKLKAQLLYPIVENDDLLGIIRLSSTISGTLKKYTTKDIEFIHSLIPNLIAVIKKLSSKNIDSENISALPEAKQNKKTENAVDDNDMLLFFSNTVHDIRTPANSLYGFLELLEDQIEDTRLKKFVTNAKESALFINSLTDSILETAKNRYLSSFGNKLSIHPVQFLSDIANDFSANILEKKIHYFIFLDPKIPKEIKIDALKLKRVLINLIGNAYKFTPPKHEINVSAFWDDVNSRIKFSIKDTGIGIEENDQKKLFRAFEQAKDDIGKKYGGSGLGLAISAGYIAELGGELKLKSKIGEGSEFYFDIPVEIIDHNQSYEKFYNLDKKIVILTQYTKAKYPKFIKEYLVAFGMPKDKIAISDQINKDTTHVICFEEKITPEILKAGKSKQFKLLLIEQKLFSLLNKKETKDINITSKNAYNGDAIYTTVYSGKKLKVLIVDDNKINIILIESILAGEFIDVHAAEDPKVALGLLKKDAKDGKKFDIVYLDKHMENMSGEELLQKYRKFEKEHKLKPIYAISITGDPDINEAEKKIYDDFVLKPFKKDSIKGVIERFRDV